MKTEISLKWSCCVLACLLAANVSCSEPEFSRKVLLGGYSNISITDEEVVAAARFAVNEQAKRESSQLHLESIRFSEQQVVAGMNYRLLLLVKNGTKEQLARAVIFRNLKSKLSLTAWEWLTAKP